MVRALALIGFGEAAMAFAPSLIAPGRACSAFDLETEDARRAAAKWRDYAAAGVRGCASAAEALAGVDAVLSLVTADQALRAAQTGAPALSPDAFWFDMNSVAPDTKRTAARAVEAAGGRYVDVAVMAPVHPARAAVALLVSGPHAGVGVETLGALGFGNVRAVPGEVGRASAIKMIRSVMVKGIEALSAECMLAAARAEVLDEVLGSLDASPPAPAWAERADYNLDRMLVHGLRRAAEMQEVAKTLEALGEAAPMTLATIERQRALGALGVKRPPEGLRDKLAVIAHGVREEAAA